MPRFLARRLKVLNSPSSAPANQVAAAMRISVLVLILCLFLAGCETGYWVQVNPPIAAHSMPRLETAEIVAITDRIASQFGMRRLTQVENHHFEAERLARTEKIRSPEVREYIRELYIDTNQCFPVLARYQIDRREVGLLATQVHTYYLTVSYVAQGKFRLRQGSIKVEPSEYMPDLHTILNMAKQGLGERFGYNRVFIGYYHPINW